MRRTDTALAALAALPPDASLADKAELCIFGKNIRRMRDWEQWLCVIQNPERYNLMPPQEDQQERHDEVTRTIQEEAKRKLGIYMADAIQNGTFKTVSTEIVKASEEYASHDFFAVKIGASQNRAFDKWAGRKRWSLDELSMLPPKQRMEAMGFNEVRRNALAVLRQVCAAKHPTHAAVLLFSRRLNKTLSVHSGSLMAESFGTVWESNLINLWQKRHTTWRCEALEEDSQPEDIIPTQLRDRVSSLLGKEVPLSDISKAASCLRISLPAGKGGRPRRT